MTDLPPATGSWIEIDASCLEANLKGLQRHIGDSELCMVVKGNAYGHGYDPVVPIAEAAGVRLFAVVGAREAAGFLEASDGKSRLMVMGHGHHENLPWLLSHGMEPWLNDPDDWQHVVAAAEDLDVPAKVHLEVETGMNRTGLEPDDAFAVAQKIWDHPMVELEGVCTHLAGRESSANDERIAAQKQVFHDFLHRLQEAGIRPNSRHMASSAAALLDEDARLDLCRVGIASYGLWPSREVHNTMQRRGTDLVLRNVLAWKSRIVACKDVDDGDYVGYGNAYEAEGDTRVAVVGVGYGDGFARALSNQGHVLIRGRRASIVGNVNMNMVQCHIGHIPDACTGDEVVLVGRQEDREISVSSFADFNAVVNYELMARLSHEIPRIVVRSDKKDLPDPLV